jgi:hypothetical protein
MVLMIIPLRRFPVIANRYSLLPRIRFPYQPGQSGRATISWNACCNSEGRVTLTVDDGPEEVFAREHSGLRFFDGLNRATRYEFRLYSEQATPATAASLSAIERTATIVADPNPVPTRVLVSVY